MIFKGSAKTLLPVTDGALVANFGWIEKLAFGTLNLIVRFTAVSVVWHSLLFHNGTSEAGSVHGGPVVVESYLRESGIRL